MPIGAAASSDLVVGQLTTSLTTGYLRVVDHEVLDDPGGPLVYDASLSLIDTRLATEVVVHPLLAFSLVVPYRVADQRVRYRDAYSGQVIAAPYSIIHARTETLTGIGDPTLLAHYAREIDRVRIHIRAGATLPLGDTVEDPFELGALGKSHEHIQFGTGTFIPFVSVEAQREVSRVTLAAFAVTYPSLYTNDKGYRAGTRISGGVSASSQLGLHAWTFSVATEVHGETAERWHGQIHLDEGNAGRLDVLGGGGVAWRAADDLALTAEVRMPVYSHVVGDQLSYSLVASVGIVGTFDLVRSSWHGVDHREIAPPGQAAALVPVAGKITVFDLYASWCAPCRRLDRELAALAHRYPDRLAVRTLDVVDPDSAAWTAHLAPGHFELPHVKVYAADGTLLFERTAPPDELVRAIATVLAP